MVAARSHKRHCSEACRAVVRHREQKKAGTYVPKAWEPVRGYMHDWNPAPATEELIEAVEGVIEKSEKSSNRLIHHVARARRARRIAFEDIRDDNVTELPGDGSRYGDSSLDGYMAGVKHRRNALLDENNYRRGKHEDQPVYIDVWTEAAGMAPQIRTAVGEYGVEVHSGGGYDSVTAKWRMSQSVGERDAPAVILHIGDFDTHGKHIYNAFAEDVEEFCAEDGGEVEIIRLAVTEEQVEQHALPSFSGAVQAEAIPPDELAKIVRAAVLEHYDEQVAAKIAERERRERQQVDRRLRELRGRDVYVEAVRRAFGWPDDEGDGP